MNQKSHTNLDFLNEQASEVAPKLLGCHLIRNVDGHKLVGKIVEVEAYDQTDAASHTYRGETLRNQVMFGPAGFLYVYFTYGMHYCMNIVCSPVGQGSAVLIRAVEPIEGLTYLEQNRGGISGKNLTNGPAKVCQAFKVNKNLNGHDLTKDPLKLIYKSINPGAEIVVTTRIGIKKAVDVPWRFYIKENAYISRL
jgi:DNA-3-methyladenine glycosylase